MDGSKQQAHATGQDNDNDNARLHGTLPGIQTVNKPLLCSRGYSKYYQRQQLFQYLVF